MPSVFQVSLSPELSLSSRKTAQPSFSHTSLSSNVSLNTLRIVAESDTDHFNVENKLVLISTIFTDESCEVNWVVKNATIPLNTSVFSLFKGFQFVKAQQETSIYLILSSGILSIHGFYVFSVNCGHLSSSIAIFPNSPPQEGSFQIVPAIGEEISTLFNFTAYAWKSENIPITYQFSYFYASIVAIQLQSQSNSTFTLLPAGLKSNAYRINCTVQVFDFYQSSSERSETIRVNPANSRGVESFINSTIHSHFPLSLQRINLIGSLLNKINTTNMPDCNLLFRSYNSLVDHTCGPCLSGYTGEAGSCNSFCFQRLSIRDVANISQPKECPNNCSSNGRCAYYNIHSGELVRICSTVSVNCNAKCICYTNFTGPSCTDTVSQLDTLQVVREKALLGLYNLSTSTSLLRAQIIALAISLSTQTAFSYELSPLSVYLTLSCAHNLLTAMTQLNTGYDAALPLIQAIDSAVSTSNYSRNLFVNTLMKYGSLVSNQLYPGQASIENIFSNFRIVTSVMFSSPKISLPLSDLEIISGKQANSIDIANLLSDQQTGKISVIELESMLFSESQFKSNPVIIQIFPQNLPSSKRLITVRLTNNLPQAIPNETDKITTICLKNMRSLIHRYKCPFSDYTIVHNCTNRVGTLSSQCPKYQAQCSNLSSATHHLCTVTFFSSTETVCNCTLNLDSISLHRRLYSNTAASAVLSISLELVATAAYVAHDFADTFQAAPNLTSVAEIGSVTIIIVMYSSIWFAGAVLFLFSARINRAKIKIEKWNGEKLSEDFPIMKENLKAYITEAIPVVLRKSDLNFRFVAEIIRHHKYANLFFSNKIPGSDVFRVVTILSLLMFLLVVFDDLQSPSDDGTCETFQSAVTCLARRSPFDQAQSYCQWNIVSDDGSAPTSYDYCSFDDSGSTLQDWVAVSVVVSLITGMFLRPIDYMLDLLEAPTTASIKMEQSRSILRGLKAGDSTRDISEDTIRARTMASKSFYYVAIKNCPDFSEQKLELGESKMKRFWSKEGSSPVSKIHELKQAILQQRLLFQNEAQQEFDDQWGLRSSSSYDEFEYDSVNQQVRSLSNIDFCPTIWRKIVCDLETVDLAAKKRIQKLKSAGSNQAGLEIFHLFLIDLLGRQSAAAKIFENKLEEDFKEEKVIRWAWKGTSGIILLLLNILFPYYTMLYGSLRGMAWQWAFLSTCVAQVFIEIFINETLECLWLNYFVPLLATSEVNDAHQVLIDLVDKVDQPYLEAREFVLDASEFHFVSKRVGKAFPSLLESSIIELYKTCLPGKSGKLWHESNFQRFVDRATTAVATGESSTVRYLFMLVFFVLSLMEYCATTPYLLQRMTVRFLQPILVAGIILLFYLVIDSPVSISIFIVAIAAFIIFIFRRRLNNILEPGKALSTVAPMESEVKAETNREDFLVNENNDCFSSVSSCDESLPLVCERIEGSCESSSLGNSFSVSLPSSFSDENSVLRESSEEGSSTEDEI